MVSRKVEREMLRSQFLEMVSNFLEHEDNEVLRVKSNEIAIPVVGCEDNEDFLVITFKVPTGANKGTEPYDGYSEAESYELKLKEKAEKAKANAKKRQKKLHAIRKSVRSRRKFLPKGNNSNREHPSRCSHFYAPIHRILLIGDAAPGPIVKKLTY